jgi:ssDNA-binding Zn-finger/Zn-ribbon topoisomerase 1
MKDNMNIIIVILSVLFIVNIIIARKKNISIFWTFLASLFFTPIIPLIYLLLKKPIIEPKMICPNCGFQGSPIKRPGNFIIELLLWCFALVPGLIYTIWRYSSSQKFCPKCNRPGMISVDSPRGQKLLKEYQS